MYLVYLLKEKSTDKVIYVGSSARPAARMKEHRQALQLRKPNNAKLYDYMRERNLQFYKDVAVVWIDVGDDKESMLKLEEQYYYKYRDTVLNDRPAEDRNGAFNPKRRQVICLTDGITFKTVSECARHYGVARTTLSGWLNGYRKYNPLKGKEFLFKGKKV